MPGIVFLKFATIVRDCLRQCSTFRGVLSLFRFQRKSFEFKFKFHKEYYGCISEQTIGVARCMFYFHVKIAAGNKGTTENSIFEFEIRIKSTDFFWSFCLLKL